MLDDQTGQKVRASETQEQWDGKIVHKNNFEPRHPQDFVRAIKDDQSVPFSRPRAVDSFIGPLTTTLTQDAAAGAILLYVASNVRMQTADRITIFLLNGDTFTTFISNISNLGQIQISPKLPSPASAGAQITDYSAIAQGDFP